MGVKTLAQGFLKEETTSSQALVELDAKKSLATLVTTAIILSPGSYKSLQANSNFIPLENKVIVENIAISNQANALSLYNRATWNNGRENFFYLRYPLQMGGNREPWNNMDINNRASLYLYKAPNPYDAAPQYIANGDQSTNKYDEGKGGMTYGSVDKALSEALKNQEQLATFSIKENQKNSDFEIEVKTTEKKLIANRNLNLVVISYLDYANNTSPDKLPKDYDYPDFIYNNVVRELPLGSEGTKIIFKNDGLIKSKFSLKRITDENRQNSGLVLALQDMSNKKLLATAVCRFANLDGIDKPMYLNWNNQPESIFTKEMSANDYEKVRIYTGLQEMTLNVRDIPTNTDLQKIGLEISKSGQTLNRIDSEYFDILGYSIPLSLQKNIKYLDFDPDTSRLEIEFIRPLTHLDAETPIFSYITHIKKSNIEKGTFNFQAKNLQILDSNNCIPYLYLNNPKALDQNQLVTRINPLDFNKDTWINEHDLSQLIDQFGTNENDKNWDPIYDIHQGGVSKGRIDIGDIRKMINENNRQNRFKEIIKEQNPWAELDSVDPTLKAEVQIKLRRLLPEYTGTSVPLSTMLCPPETLFHCMPINPEALSIIKNTNVSYDTITGTMNGTITLSHWDRKLLDLIQSDKKISVGKMSKALQLSTSTVQNHLDKLKEKGLLKRIGGTRGYWEISLEFAQ